MIGQIVWVVIALVIAWLGLLTLFFFRIVSHYNNLTQGANGKNLQAILEKIVTETDTTKKDIVLLKSLYATIEKDGRSHIQKIGLIRFNPFNDTGGDQSFILALLDKQESGTVISGLYSRSGTRWYAKQVINGKGSEHELSEEEKKAIKQATSRNTD